MGGRKHPVNVTNNQNYTETAAKRGDTKRNTHGREDTELAQRTSPPLGTARVVARPHPVTVRRGHRGLT